MKVIQMFPLIFNEEDNISIKASVTLEEVKSVIQASHKSKSPNSDG